MNILKKAELFHQFKNDKGVPQIEIAELFKVSEGFVCKLITIHKFLSDIHKKQLLHRKISVEEAYQIARLHHTCEICLEDFTVEDVTFYRKSYDEIMCVCKYCRG